MTEEDKLVQETINGCLERASLFLAIIFYRSLIDNKVAHREGWFSNTTEAQIYLDNLSSVYERYRTPYETHIVSPVTKADIRITGSLRG